MGVPTFFRWVSEKYPKIVQRCIEEEPNTFADGTEMPVDASQPNPNGMEFDNLYLDMNGIIHPFTHPEDGNEPPTIEHMFHAIGKHIERLFRLVRPRKLIYMAIDGIAPRAKMNQQRSRRFRSALEADEARADREKVIKSMKSRGLSIPTKEENKNGFDSNVITPGTEFMDRLAEYLRAFIIERQTNDEAWSRIKVILSDAQSPGEGEHKIMQFVRRQRAEAGHDPNTHHVMYGLDADLIMLGLASHEIRFTVLRDVVFFGKQNRKAGAKVDQVLQSSSGAIPDPNAEEQPVGKLSVSKLKPIEMLHVWILREYLAHEFRPESFEAPLPFPYDFERHLDDFVFLCFFVGNDFLPHLPSLSIREGGIELLLNCYRKVLPTLSGYLTEDGDLQLGRVGELMKVLGNVEDRIFQMRRAQEERDKQRKKMQQEAKKNAAANNPNFGNMNITYLGDGSRNTPESDSSASNKKPRLEASPPPEPEKKPVPTTAENKSAAAALRAQLNGGATKPIASAPKPAVEEEESDDEEEFAPEVKGAADKPENEDDGDAEELEAEIEEDDEFDPSVSYEERIKVLQSKRNEVPEEDVTDDIRFGEEGWKERYYESKFGKEFVTDPTMRRQVVESYVRGLCWVLQYYYKGCQSWKWYYEFHYAPFASDLVDLESIDLTWAPSRPFKPFEQLMAVLPPQSAHALPEPCRWYMTDSDSEIADFYPREIQFDPNGKPVRWLWIALLPFIDENRLLAVTKNLEKEFTRDEKRRNAMMPDLIFVPRNAPGAELIKEVLGKSPPNLLPNWESDQIAILQQQKEDEKSKLFGDALSLPAPTTAGDARGGGSDKIFLSAPEAGGISGYFLPAAPEFAVKVGDYVKSSFPSIVEDIQSSGTLVCEFRLPPMLPHLSRLCPNVTIPPPVLTDQDLQIRRPKLSALDVSILVSMGSQVSLGAFSASDRTWGSMEPERKYSYYSQSQQINPLLGGPPPLLPGLSSHGQVPYQGYQQQQQQPEAGNGSLLAQLQQTLRQYQQVSGHAQQAPSHSYPAPPSQQQQGGYGYSAPAYSYPPPSTGGYGYGGSSGYGGGSGGYGGGSGGGYSHGGNGGGYNYGGGGYDHQGGAYYGQQGYQQSTGAYPPPSDRQYGGGSGYHQQQSYNSSSRSHYGGGRGGGGYDQQSHYSQQGYSNHRGRNDRR